MELSGTSHAAPGNCSVPPEFNCRNAEQIPSQVEKSGFDSDAAASLDGGSRRVRRADDEDLTRRVLKELAWLINFPSSSVHISDADLPKCREGANLPLVLDDR